MKQKEMSNYLKLITVGVGIILTAFVLWFLPMVLKETLTEVAGNMGYIMTCVIIGISAIPALGCLARFWGICVRIGKNESFTSKNARALKCMSHYMLTDVLIYTLYLVWFCISGWAHKAAWLFFPILLALFVSVTLSVLCAAVSHLAYKAAKLQEEQDLTI